MNILIVFDNKKYGGVGYQVKHHNMYESELSKCIIIDTHPNFWLENGTGRILMFQWNQFLINVRRYIWKNKYKRKIFKFWKGERFKVVRKNTNLPVFLIKYIFSFI